MFAWRVIAVIVILVLSGASMLAIWAYGRFAKRARGEPSFALPRLPDGGALDRKIAPLTAARPGESALVLLASNIDAFAARVLTARAASRSLDLMYYIWDEDLTGRLLMAELLTAADRGVRVRLLLDDIGVSSRDEVLLVLNAHPLIEVRLFNPTQARKSGLRRGIEMGLRFFSVTRRMHNKAWIADGRVALMGGRNIGDAYFDAAETSNFRDLDLLTFGPVVDETEAMFDAYWNSGLALPIRALAGKRLGATQLETRRHALLALADSDEARPYIAHVRAQAAQIVPGDEHLHWCAEARLTADPPEKTLGKKGENWMMRELLPLLGKAESRINITSPYFVPKVEGTTQLTAIARRGVTVKVLTNSLASSDVAAVHGGYAPYRKPLLAGGVALYELRPALRKRLSFRGSSNASLHTKAFTVDGRIGFIGSLNFDPRSASLNTEMGVLFVAPRLIEAMDRNFAEEIAPGFSYAVRLDTHGRLRWHGDEEEGGTIHHQDPEASLFRRAIARAVGWLPLEAQL